MASLPHFADLRWSNGEAIARQMIAQAPHGFLADLRKRLRTDGVDAAVVSHDTATLFDWCVEHLALQGISNAAARAYAERHPKVRWRDLELAMLRKPSCPRLRSYWSFFGCQFHKGSRTCAEPEHIERCPLPRLQLRKGTLHQAAFGLWLLVRDICRNDIVAWIDDRLFFNSFDEEMSFSAVQQMLVGPLFQVPGTGLKVWSMILAELMLVDPTRDRWVAAGAAMVAIDSLVHSCLSRTGMLRRLNAEHAYGPACYHPNGCVGLVEGLARRIDARSLGADYPAYFPRLIQFGIWWHCAEAGANRCNARQIDDRVGCRQVNCVAYTCCDRLPIPCHQ